jgi:predicted amidohydrolase
MLKLACVQMDVIPGEVTANLRAITGFIDASAAKGARLVVLPELATTDYYVDDFMPLACQIPGAHSNVICDAASRNKAWVAAGLLERTTEGMYNTAVLVSPDGAIIGTTRKTHLSVDTRHGTIARETDLFLPGDDLPVFDTGLARVGMMICKDGEYPEVPRVLAVKGAEIIVWMTNRHFVNREASIHYALSNSAAVVVANRAKGHAEGGGSIVLDWEGRTLSDAGSRECIAYAEIDMDRLREARRCHWNENRVRRPELYRVLGT